MRWPFGPPHLTLPKKNSKKPKTPQKNQKTKKQKTKKTNKKNKKKEHVKKPKIPKKSFSIISQNIFWGVSKNCLFLTTWPRKRAPPKHYKNRVSAYFF